MGNHPHERPPTRHPLGDGLLSFLPSQSHSSQAAGMETPNRQVADHASRVPCFSVQYSGFFKACSRPSPVVHSQGTHTLLLHPVPAECAPGSKRAPFPLLLDP